MADFYITNNVGAGTRQLVFEANTVALDASDRSFLIRLLSGAGAVEEIVLPDSVDPGANPDRFTNEDGTTFTNEDGTEFQNENAP